MNAARYWTVVVLLVLAAILRYKRGDVDYVPPSQPLSGLPHQIDGWNGIDLPLDPEVMVVIGKGIFLNRTYTPQTPAPADQSGPVIGLFIGYFPTQRTGQSIHSPQNCLPGAGWNFESSGVTDISGPGGKNYRVGEYVVTNGINKDEVLYWYQSHGRAIASDYKAKLYMLVDSARLNRTDAALVRIVTPIRLGESREAAQERAKEFARNTVDLLPAYIPD